MGEKIEGDCEMSLHSSRHQPPGIFVKYDPAGNRTRHVGAPMLSES